MRFQPADRAAAKRTVPPRAGSSPMIARTVVVLPMPLRPSRASTSPSATERDTSNNTGPLP